MPYEIWGYVIEDDEYDLSYEDVPECLEKCETLWEAENELLEYERLGYYVYIVAI